MAKMKGKAYEKEMARLQGELCMLQDYVKESGQRVVIVFEGRDAAGKGGTIRPHREGEPRIFRVIRTACPSDREKSQCKSSGTFSTSSPRARSSSFDRSWTTAPAWSVMGFCTEKQYQRFLSLTPMFEKQIVDSGIQLIKIWLEVGNEEQERRFKARIEDPLRQWKLSPMDLPSRERWYEYSRARDAMLKATDTKHAPWYIVRSDDKKRARLNLIAHLLKLIPYKKVKHPKVTLPPRSKKHAYDDEATLGKRRFIPERY